MAKYEGKVVTRGNQIRTVEIQAKTEADALRQLKQVGQVVTVRKRRGFDLGQGLTPGDRQIFFSRLSSMLSSRVGTSDALQLLRDTFPGRISEIAGRLLGYVQNGMDLPDAFERIGSSDFPGATVALIKAGSRSGETHRAIKEAADFEYQLHVIRQGAGKGLGSGLFGFVAAFAMIVASNWYAGPEIMNSPLMKSAAANAAIDIGWINTTATWSAYVMGVLMVVGLSLYALATLGKLVMPLLADSIILKIPYYKDLVLSRNNFIVLFGLSLLIKSGVRVEEALRLSGETAPKGALRADLFAANLAVMKGKPWPVAMKTLHPTDKAALSCATDREQIAQTLGTLATQYRELYGQRLASFVPALGMTAAIFLSLAGAIIFGQTVLPMLMSTQGLL
jgi:general secretion pathway protein F